MNGRIISIQFCFPTIQANRHQQNFLLSFCYNYGREPRLPMDLIIGENKVCKLVINVWITKQPC